MSPSNFRQGVGAVNAAADAVTSLLDGGTLRIYDGPQPLNPSRPVGASCVLLVQLDFQTPAFSLAVAGAATAHPLEPQRALAGGTPTWFRAVSRTGQAIFDGTVGGEGSGADLVLLSASIPAGSDVVIEQFVYVQPSTGGET